MVQSDFWTTFSEGTPSATSSSFATAVCYITAWDRSSRLSKSATSILGCGLRPDGIFGKDTAGRSYVDLDGGIFYRRPEGRAETKKRQPPVPIPPRLLAHMRRWVDKGIAHEHFVEWHGAGVRSVKTAFNTAARSRWATCRSYWDFLLLARSIIRDRCAIWSASSIVMTASALSNSATYRALPLFSK
jgi:hypothetical protein